MQSKSKIKLLFLFGLFISLSLMALILPSSSIYAATTNGVYSIVLPNSGNLVQECPYSADIWVDTGSNTSNAADVIVLFDPTKVEIIDSNLSQSSPTVKQIKPGPAYEVYPAQGNRVDELNGIIRLSGVSLSSSLNGSKIFGTIQFKSKPGATTGSFIVRFDGIGYTLDSNIADLTTSTDLLGSKQDGNFTFTSGACALDTTPPNINFVNPVNNEGSVGISENISITISDLLSGVDISTLEIYINGVLYSSISPQVQISGNSSLYTIIVDPTETFYVNSPSSIVVKSRDFAGNLRQSSISFNFPVQPVPTAPRPAPPPAPDLIAPRIQFINPIANETIGSSEEIVINLTDEGSGLNLNNLIIFINDKKYVNTDSTVSITGTANNYQVVIRDNFKFPITSTSTLSVFVTDIYGNASSGTIQFNIPRTVINETKPCPVVSNTCTSNAPFSEEMDGFQETLSSLTPETLRPLADNAGFLGMASLIALLPLLAQILFTLGGVIAGGFLWPFLYSLIIPSKRKLGLVIDEYTKEGLSFVRITVKEKTSGAIIRKAYTDFSGKYLIRLDPGMYIFTLEKKGYVLTNVEAQIVESKDLDFKFEMIVKEATDLGTQVQLQVFKFDPILFTSIIATIISAINLIYVRNVAGIIIFLLTLIGLSIITFKYVQTRKVYIPSKVVNEA